MKTATIAAAFIALALSPASAQSPGDQLTCIGKLFNNDVFPPNRIVVYGRPLIHIGEIFDQEGGYECTFDRDGAPFPADQWPCRGGDTCRVVGTLAWEIRSLRLLIRDGKQVKDPWYAILKVISVEKLGDPPPAVMIK
jgi:hypothetical protein